MSSFSATASADALAGMTINWTDHGSGNNDTSLFTTEYTYAMDSFSCHRTLYFLHVAFAYAVFATGLLSLITRILPAAYRQWHAWFGRLYVLCMLWCTCTSLIVHNNGLPTAVLVSFLGVMLGLTIGWIVICLYKQSLHKQATAIAVERIAQEAATKGTVAATLTPDYVEQAVGSAKQKILSNQTFLERLVSFKTLHGALFFMTWFQISGRVFVTTPTSDFTCNTYMVYKPIHIVAKGDFSNQPLTVVPSADPEYDRLPWSSLGPVTWASLLIVGSFFIAIVVGAIWHYCDARIAAASRSRAELDDDVPEDKGSSGDNTSADAPSSEADSPPPPPATQQEFNC